MGKGFIGVIEDDLDIGALYAEILADEGYDVALWTTGAGAFAFVQRINPVLVILDMHMETRDAGLQVAERLCADPATNQIPVIVCSAGIDTERAKRARLEAMGCKIHGKPIDILMLLAVIAALTR